ncbi:hypothetical protein FOTG_16962 [Fusarium oxysporum f. sp. vasinfectum 25433]|uniref:Uncharacterized protein n=1 Tax=Fusarium oxysporum f. sp. vasinfectum 25433 TaxID=1089449 RepID=X0M1R6_FUSOX|nr:hypothetical protein FOTG_16962 [Fusarium oxysporum f. sp. vasinfectum 25433]
MHLATRSSPSPFVLSVSRMDHKIFQYGLIKGTRGFASLNNDNVAYLTRNGTIGSVRNDDGRFLAVLQSQLRRFDIEKQHIQHISTKSGFEVYIQFSSWRRFVELSWEGDSCRATAELPKGLKNVNVQLRKGTTVITLGTTSPEPLTYALDDRDIYTILFDPAMYEGFVVVFSADGEHQNDMRAISKPLAYRGPLCCKINEAHTLQSASSSGLVCTMKISPDLLRNDSQRADNAIDRETSAELRVPSDSNDRQSSHHTDAHGEPTDDTIRTSAQVSQPSSIEEMEQHIEACLRENQTSPYELAELCEMFPGHAPITYVECGIG